MKKAGGPPVLLNGYVCLAYRDPQTCYPKDIPGSVSHNTLGRVNCDQVPSLLVLSDITVALMWVKKAVYTRSVHGIP